MHQRNSSVFSGLLKLKSPMDVVKKIHSPAVQLLQDCQGLKIQTQLNLVFPVAKWGTQDLPPYLCLYLKFHFETLIM